VNTKINDVLTALDKKSYLRLKLFQLFAIDSIDGMRFIYNFVDKSRRPYVGWFYSWFMSKYYKYVHTGAVKLPIADIEAFLMNASHVSVGPCPCRLIFDKGSCDAPIFTCMRVNYFSETMMDLQDMVNRWREKNGKKPKQYSKELTKEEAIALVRYAYHKHNLTLSLESCVTPYQNNICMCCADCCIEFNMRYKYGLDVCKSGPYLPELSPATCTSCGKCADRCQVHAITMDESHPSVDPGICLGCGQCATICDTNSLAMKVDPKRMPSYKEPGWSGSCS
jgi:ferredoxin